MRPRFRRFLILSLVLSNLALMIFVIFNLIHLLPGMGYAAHVKACITPDYHNWSVGASYVTPIFMESLIFFATLFHAFEYRKTHPRARSTWTGTMLHRLYVDGIQYYLLVLLFRLGTVLVFYTAPFALQLLFSYFEYLVSSTLTSRFFLSFRRTLVNVQTLSTQATNSSSTATGPGFSRAFSWSVKVGSKDSRTDTSGTVGTNEHHAMEELHIQ
ncbi:hypothetical protein FRC17_001492 [Serendipita sp. 399]|nr:hypothetical protein FRC17_001492 [Serendipita sp. 399]